MVSVIRMPAAQAFELCLCRTILRFAVSADRAGLTRIGRRHFYDGSAIELSFPVEFGKEEPPTLIEYGSVETALLLHMSTRFLRRPFCRCRHVLDLEVFPHNHCVVFAELERKLLKEVLADVGDVLVEFCDAFFLFALILPEFRHSGEAFLFKTEFLQILLQGVARCFKSAVRQRAEPFDAHVQADSVSLVFRRNALKPRLNGHVPTVSPTAHCDVLGLSFNEPTPPVLHPTDTRQQDLLIAFVDFEVLGKAEGIGRCKLLVELRETRIACEEPLKTLTEVFHRLLQALRIGLCQPGMILLPNGKLS